MGAKMRWLDGFDFGLDMKDAERLLLGCTRVAPGLFEIILDSGAVGVISLDENAISPCSLYVWGECEDGLRAFWQDFVRRCAPLALPPEVVRERQLQRWFAE